MTCSNETGPQTQDFQCTVGDDFARVLQLVDGVTGQPISAVPVNANLALWNFYMSIYSSWASKLAGDDPIISMSTALGNFTINDVSLAKINMLISRDATRAVTVPALPPYGSDTPQLAAVYDFIGVDESGAVQTEMRGTFTFSQNLTVAP